MPSIKSFELFEGVTETVVPGQTRTSPPLDNANTVVSLPAVKEDPAANRLSAKTTSPTPPGMGTTAAAGVKDTACGGWIADFSLAALGSSGALSRTIRRLPAASHEYP